MPNEALTALHTRRRFLSSSLTAGLGLTILSGCGSSASSKGSSSLGGPKAKVDGDLNYFNWSQYLDPKLIAGFEKEYGVTVHQTYFDNMAGMMAKIRAGVSYDLIWPEAPYASQLVQGNVLMPIDRSQLKNWGQVIDFFKSPWYDPHSTHTVPYAYWTTGIAWRTDLVSGMQGTWSDLWNHPSASGKIVVLDDEREALGMSLLRLGNDLNSTDQSKLNAAGDALIKLRPQLRAFNANDIPLIESEDVWIQHAWSGDFYIALQSVKDPQNWRYEVCTDGVVVGSDTMAIPANASHPGTAMLFIDWMLDPAHAAQNVNYFGYPQGTIAGGEAFQKLVVKYPWLNVSTDMLAHGNEIRSLTPQATQQWSLEWARVQA